ncbi:MAG: type II CAAX endopeptidase family protein [Bryobacteraceae bacterium]|jgi:membrane protease YdiL (CAAX protease family)
MTPQEQAPKPDAFWSYQDLALFVSFTFLSAMASTLLVILLRLHSMVLRVMLLQMFLYVFVVGSLYAILRLRYRQPFWRALGMRYPDKRAWVWAFAGPALAILLGIVAVLLRAPQIQLPFQDFLRNPLTTAALGVLVVLLGPLCEELVFRGFLMPLLVRSLTAVPGILLAAVLFGCMHGPEYHWSWRHVLLISLAGVAFGYARQLARSTTASFLMHATFNLTQFAAFLFSQQPTKW